MKETETREFKRSLSELKAGLVSVTAMLNKHERGELWFGIRNDGTAVGLDVTEKTLRDVSQSIASHIEPCIYPKITHETIDGANCIKIAAFEGLEDAEVESVQAGKQPRVTSSKSSSKSSPKGSPKTVEQIIELIRSDSTISTERIGELLGISKRAVLKHTRKLQDQKRLTRVGPARGGHWEVQE